MIRSADRSSGKRIVRAQTTLQQSPPSQQTLIPLLQFVRPHCLPPRHRRRHLQLFILPVRGGICRVLLLLLLVPRDLPRLALFPRSFLVRSPLAVDGPRVIFRRRPARLPAVRFVNGTIAVRKITIKYSSSRVATIVARLGNVRIRVLLDAKRFEIAALYDGFVADVVGVVLTLTMTTAWIVAVLVTSRPPLLLQGWVRHCRCSCRGVYHLVAATTAALFHKLRSRHFFYQRTSARRPCDETTRDVFLFSLLSLFFLLFVLLFHSFVCASVILLMYLMREVRK